MGRAGLRSGEVDPETSCWVLLERRANVADVIWQIGLRIYLPSRQESDTFQLDVLVLSCSAFSGKNSRLGVQARSCGSDLPEGSRL